MSKKKRFSVSNELQRGLSETISVVENNRSTYRGAVIPISRIELDPENPRQLIISLEDVRKELSTSDPLYAKKQKELNSLQELSNTIINKGLLNPIIVYKRGDKYRVVAGERRTLASVIANKNEIEARIYNEKPSDFDLKLTQWIENMAREDLSLAERIINIRDLVDHYQKENADKKPTLRELEKFISISKTQISAYMKVLNGPADLLIAVTSGQINNLDKAAFISSIDDPDIRKIVLNEAIKGTSIDLLLKLLDSLAQDGIQQSSQKPSFIRQSVKFGTTKNPRVAELLIKLVLANNDYDINEDHVGKTDWGSPESINKTFRKLVLLLEKKIGETK